MRAVYQIYQTLLFNVNFVKMMKYITYITSDEISKKCITSDEISKKCITSDEISKKARYEETVHYFNLTTG